MRLRTSRASLTTSKPSTRAEPAVGIRSVISILIVVVFPAPFGERHDFQTSGRLGAVAKTTTNRKAGQPVMAPSGGHKKGAPVSDLTLDVYVRVSRTNG